MVRAHAELPYPSSVPGANLTARAYDADKIYQCTCSVFGST